MPVWLAPMIAATAISTGASILGGQMGASAQAKAARAQAGMLREEARYQGLKAEWEIGLLQQNLEWELGVQKISTAAELSRLRRSGRLTAGMAEARVGAAGVAMEGSPEDAMTALERVFEMDADILEYNAAITRQALIRDATIEEAELTLTSTLAKRGLTAQAGYYDQAARSALLAGKIGTVTELMRGTSQVLGAYAMSGAGGTTGGTN